uniref:Putative secreted peptide n=1 Tax=Anopheles braziliensis TaxID=58242 RepID=A0A2M3ZTD7_9DIPT
MVAAVCWVPVLCLASHGRHSRHEHHHHHHRRCCVLHKSDRVPRPQSRSRCGSRVRPGAGERESGVYFIIKRPLTSDHEHRLPLACCGEILLEVLIIIALFRA